MKKILFTLFILSISAIYAQQEVPPQGINYQAVIYSDEEVNMPGANLTNQPLSNQEISILFSIYTAPIPSALLYTELHVDTTDEFGMVSVVIGQGVVEGETLFEDIAWDDSEYFLRVSVKKNPEAVFVPMSFEKLWSVPYALYSGTSSSSEYSDSSEYANLAGNGLTGVTDNGDGTLTFEYFNGSSFTTGVLNGLEGPQGEMGPAGADGQDGADGAEGAQGPQGIQGEQGPTGNNGVDGTDGLSAYEVWLSLGNTGTEQEFLNSLMGPQGSSNGDMLYWNGTEWIVLNGGSSDNQILVWCNGIPTWTDDGLCFGTISSIDCGSINTTGNLVQEQVANNVTMDILYTDGNGGSFGEQTIISSGVTGLSANLASGTFAEGDGSLTYIISGTPNTSGTASFAINIGGQSCTISLNVAADFSAQYPTGSNFGPDGPTAIVDIVSPVTGRIWMDRNLGATQPATSSDDEDSFGFYYQAGRGTDGHQIRNSNLTTSVSFNSDQPGHGDFITVSFPNSDWRNPVNELLWEGPNGINNPCPNGYRPPTSSEMLDEFENAPTYGIGGGFYSHIRFTKGGWRRPTIGLIPGPGTVVNEGVGHYWTAVPGIGVTINSSGLLNVTASYTTANSAVGRCIRCIKDEETYPVRFDEIDCGAASVTGTLTQGQAANNVSVDIPFTYIVNGVYDGMVIVSTGVNGLTATLSPGSVPFGSGTPSGDGVFTFVISGTPTSSGTANFFLYIDEPNVDNCVFSINVD